MVSANSDCLKSSPQRHDQAVHRARGNAVGVCPRMTGVNAFSAARRDLRNSGKLHQLAKHIEAMFTLVQTGQRPASGVAEPPAQRHSFTGRRAA